MNAEIDHRAGFVVLGGRSNVGKSTLVNRLVGHKVAIVTPKPQTTRRRILGIRSDRRAQIIFIDTPGLHQSPKLLNQRMAETARKSLAEGEVVAGVVEAADRLSASDLGFVEEMRAITRPRILVVNKIDTVGHARLLPMLEECSRELPGAELVPVSARTGENCEELLRTIVAMLAPGPSLMAEDEYTDQSERMLAAEIIREKLFLKLEREIPFSTAVTVENFSEDKDLIRISALIIVERESHKGIVIGAGGGMLKQVGTAARFELEEIFARRAFLELHVKVEREWTRNPRRLQELGL